MQVMTGVTGTSKNRRRAQRAMRGSERAEERPELCGGHAGAVTAGNPHLVCFVIRENTH